MEASSCAIRAPRSLLASSSRSMTSNFSLRSPTCTPPAALISAIAISAPSRMETPMGADPPVNGPVIAILIVSAPAPAARNPDARSTRSVFFMQFLPGKDSGARRRPTNGAPAPFVLTAATDRDTVPLCQTA